MTSLQVIEDDDVEEISLARVEPERRGSTENEQYPKYSKRQEALIQELKKRYAELMVVSLPEGLPPSRGHYDHAIEFKDLKTKPYARLKMPWRPEKEEMRRQVKSLLEKGFIRPSKSPYGRMILFVKKKDGTLRMRVDYWALNALTKQNRYPLPRIESLLDERQGARYFFCTRQHLPGCPSSLDDIGN